MIGLGLGERALATQSWFIVRMHKIVVCGICIWPIARVLRQSNLLWGCPAPLTSSHSTLAFDTSLEVLLPDTPTEQVQLLPYET
jgi:hypothetical protein